MNRTLAVMLVTAFVLIAAQVAWSAIPSNSGQITGCYQTTGGALRVVAKKSACDPATERSLVWSQAAVPFDVDVPIDGAPYVPITNKFGIAVSQSCYGPGVGGTYSATLLIDPGASGAVYGDYTEQDASGMDPTAVSNPGQAGVTVTVPSSEWGHAEGTLLVKNSTTSPGYATLTFHIAIDQTTGRCQFMGIIRPA